MIKILLALLLIPAIAFGAADTIGGVAVTDIDTIGGVSIDSIDTIGGVTVETCSESYNPGWTSDVATRGVGAVGSVDYYGMLYTPTDSECVCQVLVYNEQIDGTLTSSHDYYMVFFTLDGIDAQTIMDTSEKVDGDGLSNDTWITFSFTSCVDLTGSTQYGIGIFVDTDSNLTDDPEADVTNHWNFGDDNNNAGDTITGGRIHWTWDAAIPYTGVLDDADDDPLFVIWTE